MTNEFNTIIGIAGTIFGLVSILISIYFFKKSKKTKNLSINSVSTILISENLNEYENLKISYNNEDIRSLTSTTIKIKNIGTDIVEPSDLLQSSPIIIDTTEKFLLNDISQYDITSSNNKNNVSLNKITDSSLQLTFEILKPKDEISISVLHTGDITVSGELKTTSIKNFTKKKYKNNDTNDNHDNDYKEIKILLFSIAILVMAIVTLAYIFIDFPSVNTDNILVPLVLMCILLVTFQISQNIK